MSSHSESESLDDVAVLEDSSQSTRDRDEGNRKTKERKSRDMIPILCSKVTVYLVLLLAAASVGTVTWYLTKGDEVVSFESEVRTGYRNWRSSHSCLADQRTDMVPRSPVCFVRERDHFHIRIARRGDPVVFGRFVYRRDIILQRARHYPVALHYDA